MIKRLVVLLGFVLLAVIWFWKEVFLNYLFCFSDLNFYFYPYRHFMTAAVKHGLIPLWNPYLLLGFPFLATLQPGLFYPFSLLYYLLPFNPAFNWFFIIHFPLAAFFMYLLGREFKLSVPAAIGAGLTFGFSGYLASVLHMPTTLASVIWLPLLVLVWSKVVNFTGNRLLAIAASGLLLALMFLGGEPTVLYGSGWIMLSYLFFKRWGEWREISMGLVALCLAFLLAGLLTAVQLFPFIELLMHSSRAGGISFAEASYFSLQLKDLFELVIPFFAHLTAYPWVSMGWTKFSYLGIIPLALALVGLLLAKGKKAWWLAAAILFVVLIVLGSHSPVPVYLLLFKYVPGFSFFRYPVKFLFVLVFILSFLAGRGIDLLAETEKKRSVLIFSAAITTGLSVIYFWLIFHGQQAYELLKPFFVEEIRQGFEASLKAATVPRDIANFGILVFLFALFTLALAVFYFKKINRRFFSYGLAGLILVDLMTANMGNNFSAPANLYMDSVPENIRRLQADKNTFRYLVSPALERRSHYETSNEFGDYRQAVLDMRNRLTSNQGMLYGLSDVDGYESIRGADQQALIKRIWGLNSLAGIHVLDMLNIKYLAASWPFRQSGFKLLAVSDDVFKNGKVFLYENLNYLPRQYRVRRARIMPDRSRALDYIFSRQFDPKSEIVLEEPVQSRGGFWFASEWYYPGWRAYVDGRETKIYRANFMFRAVPLPPGQHSVRFIYDPWLFRAGALVSLLTLAGLLVALGLNFRYTKNREALENPPEK